MLLLAIDLYGIQPFQKPTRFSLRPGFNIMTGPNGSGKSTIYRVLSSLLLNRISKEISFYENEPVQAAVIFQSKSGETYRIAADFLKGILKLSKLESGGKAVLIEKDRERVNTWIQQEVNGIGEEALSSLFMMDRSRLPSTASIPPIPLAKEGPRSQLSPPTATVRAEKEKELKEAQKRVEEVTQYEDELVRMRDEAAMIKHRIDQSRSLDLQWNQLQEIEIAKFSAVAGIKSVPSDVLDQYEKAVERKEEERMEMEDEKRELENHLLLLGEGEDPLKDRPLQVGLGIIGFSFILPFVITLRGLFRYIFLIGVAAGMMTSLHAYRKFNRRISQKRSIEKKRAGLMDKAIQIEKTFEKEHKSVIDLIKKTGSKDVQGFRDLQRGYQAHLQKKQELLKEREGLLKGETLEQLEEQHQALEKKIKELEEKMRQFDGLSQEIYRLQEEIRVLGSAGDSLEIEMPLSGPSAPVERNGFAASLFPKEVWKGLSLPLDQVQKQANTFYSLFSPLKKREMTLDDAGEIKVGQTGLGHLSSGTADQAFFSLLLSILDQFDEAPFPFVLDDPFISFNPESRDTAIDLLRGISKKRQVLLLTVHSTPPSSTDHLIHLASS